MRIYYVTLNTADEARQISRVLLEKQLAVCTNWFPITCAYRWEGKTVEEAETVLLIKTQSGYRSAVEQVIREHINYTNFIAEIAPESVNEGYLKWLNTEVPVAPNREGLACAESKTRDGSNLQGPKTPSS
jgi:periplasmic divalent cation tolerance protein